jgi:hypothetical protein
MIVEYYSNFTVMGIFDFLFENKRKKERIEKERLAEQERIRLAREKEIAEEREKRLAENRRKEELAKLQAEQQAQSLFSVSIKEIIQGTPFEIKLGVSVVKQPYNGEAVQVKTDNNATAIVRRVTQDGNIDITFSNLHELQIKGVIQANLNLVPNFEYNKDSYGNEFASAEINNSFAAVASGKEYISLFQITRQKGEIVSFLVNNLPNVEDFYYLIMLRQSK